MLCVTEYEVNAPYCGVVLGRVANRIHRGQFTLDGRHYELVVNGPVNHLHGGEVGFSKVCVRTALLSF